MADRTPQGEAAPRKLDDLEASPQDLTASEAEAAEGGLTTSQTSTRTRSPQPILQSSDLQDNLIIPCV